MQAELSRRRLEILFEQIEHANRDVPAARDAWIDAESRYRGGVGNSGDVLDADSDAIEAEIRRIDLIRQFREADALRQRWSEP